MSATTSVFVLTEQPPYLGNIKKDGAAEQIQLFLMARKRWARRQSKDTTLPTLSQLMEESDVNSLCTISLARLKEKINLSSPSNTKKQTRAMKITRNNSGSLRMKMKTRAFRALLQIENFLRRRDETQLFFYACLENH